MGWITLVGPFSAARAWKARLQNSCKCCCYVNSSHVCSLASAWKTPCDHDSSIQAQIQFAVIISNGINSDFCHDCHRQSLAHLSAAALPHLRLFTFFHGAVVAECNASAICALLVPLLTSSNSWFPSVGAGMAAEIQIGSPYRKHKPNANLAEVKIGRNYLRWVVGAQAKWITLDLQLWSAWSCLRC